LGWGFTAAILAGIILVSFILVPANAFDFNPLPAANVKTMPTENS